MEDWQPTVPLPSGDMEVLQQWIAFICDCPPSAPGEIDPYWCWCSKQFDGKKLLESHWILECPLTPLKCEHCNVIYKRSELNEHQHAHPAPED